MKKNVIVALSTIFVTGLLILLSYYLINHVLLKTSVKASLYVNGLKKGSETFIVKNGKCVSAIVPFSAIQDDINAVLLWEEDDVVQIKCNDVCYYYDFKETKLLVDQEKSLWVPLIAPGTQGNATCEKRGDDIVFDDVTLSSLLSFMGIKMKTNISLQEKSVSIVFLS